MHGESPSSETGKDLFEYETYNPHSLLTSLSPWPKSTIQFIWVAMGNLMRNFYSLLVFFFSMCILKRCQTFASLFLRTDLISVKVMVLKESRAVWTHSFPSHMKRSADCSEPGIAWRICSKIWKAKEISTTLKAQCCWSNWYICLQKGNFIL